MTGSLPKKKKEEKRGCSLIRACSLIRSNTVHHSVQPTIFDFTMHIAFLILRYYVVLPFRICWFIIRNEVRKSGPCITKYTLPSGNVTYARATVHTCMYVGS